jgi:hypothetical protein
MVFDIDSLINLQPTSDYFVLYSTVFMLYLGMHHFMLSIYKPFYALIIYYLSMFLCISINALISYSNVYVLKLRV